MDEKLMDGLAGWMEMHGTVLSEQERSSGYTGVRVVEVCWNDKDFRIIQVDGVTCRIERC